MTIPLIESWPLERIAQVLPAASIIVGPTVVITVSFGDGVSTGLGTGAGGTGFGLGFLMVFL
jgi:hypothetical protein